MIGDLRNQEIDFIIGEGIEKIDPQEIQNLLDRRSTERFVNGERTQELGLIEWLALSGLKGWTEVAQTLDIIGLFERDSKRSPTQKDSDAVRKYIIHRWGERYKNFCAFVQFSKTRFIGRNNH